MLPVRFFITISAFVIYLLPNAQAAVVQRFVIGEFANQTVPSNHASYWVEAAPQTGDAINTSNTNKVATILSMPENHWQAVELATISAGPQPHPTWFKVAITNALAHSITRILEIRWLNIKALDLYIKRQSGIEHQFYGINSHGEFKAVGDSSFQFNLSLAENEQVELFFRVDSQYFTLLPLYIWQPEAYQAYKISFHRWYALGFGALLALLLYNLTLSAIVNDRSYLIYCCYVASIISYELSFNGIGSAFLWGNSRWMHEHGLGFGIAISFLSGALFMREFLNLRAFSLLAERLLQGTVLYWAVVLAAILLFQYFMLSSIYASSICCFAAFFIALYIWYLGNPSAKYYLAAWTVLLVSTMGMLLMIYGVLPYNPVTEHGQMIGFVTEMLLLSFALAARINQERNQKDRIQQRALQLQLDINRERKNTIEAQQQVLDLEKQNSQILENRVKERTKELQNTMQELERANEKLAQLTVTDALTGLANRRQFDVVLQKEIQRTARNQQYLSLVLMDIDHFKQLNDVYGHLAGDECLREFGGLLRQIISRSTDLAARYGGEEFAIILPDTDQQAAFTVAEKVRTATQHLDFCYKGKQIPVTISLGIIGLLPSSSSKSSELIDAADSALYRAKTQGRNRSICAPTAITRNG